MAHQRERIAFTVHEIWFRGRLKDGHGDRIFRNKVPSLPLGTEFQKTLRQ